jgi:hypothetical protein
LDIPSPFPVGVSGPPIGSSAALHHSGASDALSPGVSDALSPGVSDALSPGVSDALSPGVSDALSPGVSDALSPGVSDALQPPDVLNVLSLGVSDALPPGISDALNSSGVSGALTGVSSSPRPNTSLPFPAYAPSTSVPASSSLDPAGIRRALALYPDPGFVDTLCHIATHGARIGYEGPSDVRMRRYNHRSVYDNPSVVSDAVKKELAKNRILPLRQLPERYFCSPIGVVPKRTDGIQTGWRLIFDLSCPVGASVNDGIPSEYGAISYESLRTAIRMVAKAGRGAKMIKRDLKSAFRYVPVSWLDQWCLIFEWEGQYYVELFLPFGLRTSPRIFNLFSEAIHWVLETIYGWSITHYLDDFFAVFPAHAELDGPSQTFDNVLSEIGFVKAPEKDESGTVVTHLGFQIDSDLMEVRLPPNKHARAVRAVSELASRKLVPQAFFEETLGFLSHCCQVIPLGRPFLRKLFSLLKRKSRYRRIRLNSEAKQDLRWWTLFLSSWSTISLIQLSRVVFHVNTDASGLKGIGGVYDGRIFSSRVPSRHKEKHINWKEMFAVLHAVILWHKEWTYGSVDVACDNAAVVGGINKRSIRGPAIRPLRAILLISAVFDIDIKAHWVSTKENVIADAASRHDFKKLAKLGFKDQVVALRHRPSAPIRMSTLRQQLTNYFATRSLPPPTKLMPLSGDLTNRSAPVDITPLSLPQLCPSPTGSPSSLLRSAPQRSKATPRRCDHTTRATVCPQAFSKIRVSTSSSKAQDDFMGKENVGSGSRSRKTSSSNSSPSSHSISTVSTSELRFASPLPPSSGLANSPGTRGILQPLPDFISPDNISNSPLLASPLPSRRQRQPSPLMSIFTSPHRHHPCVPSPPSAGSSHNTLLPQIPLHLPAPSGAHLQSSISSAKSTSTFSEPVSPPLVSQDTRCEKGPPCRPMQKDSRKTKSSPLGDGKAMLSTFTSTTFPKPPLPPILPL